MLTVLSRALSVVLALGLAACDGAALAPDGSKQDASPKTFACGPSQCDAATEYCYETFTCVAQEGVDFGAGRGFSCMPIPSSCEGKSNACGCTLKSLGGGDGPDDNDAITTASDGADGGCSLAENCV